MKIMLSEMLDSRSNNYDFLRFCAALLVLFSHSFYLRGFAAAEPFAVFSKGQTTFGELGVNIFFFISGLLITQSYCRSKSLLVFAKNRFLRLYPAYLVLFIAMTFLVGPLISNMAMHAYFNDSVFRAHLTGFNIMKIHDSLPGVFLYNPFPRAVNGSLWTIIWEIRCYFDVALIGVLGLYKSKKYSSIAIVLILINFWFRSDDHWFRLFLPFAIGMFYYIYRTKIVLSRVGFYCALFLYLWSTKLGVSQLVVFPLFGCYALTYFAYSPKINLNGFGKYGDFSYGMYIYAWPVQQITVLYFGVMGVFVNFSIVFFATLFFAALSWKLVENPALQLKKAGNAEIVGFENKVIAILYSWFIIIKSKIHK